MLILTDIRQVKTLLNKYDFNRDVGAHCRQNVEATYIRASLLDQRARDLNVEPHRNQKVYIFAVNGEILGGFAVCALQRDTVTDDKIAYLELICSEKKMRKGRSLLITAMLIAKSYGAVLMRLSSLAGALLIVPRLFFAGLSQIQGQWWFTTVMAVAQGDTLVKYLHANKLTAQIFAEVERAIYSMWMIGVAHADFHPGNIMFDPRTNKVTIIDLGFAVKLPDPIIRQLRSTASVMADPAEIYKNIVSKYVSSVMWKRGGAHQFQWFNPEGRVLQMLYNQVEDKENVPAARLKSWTSLSIKNAKAQIIRHLSSQQSSANKIKAYYADAVPMNID